jgi:hypothetical protein
MWMGCMHEQGAKKLVELHGNLHRAICFENNCSSDKFGLNKMRNYWLDLFTGTRWKELLKAGGQVSGFRESKWI